MRDVLAMPADIIIIKSYELPTHTSTAAPAVGRSYSSSSSSSSIGECCLVPCRKIFAGSWDGVHIMSFGWRWNEAMYANRNGNLCVALSPNSFHSLSLRFFLLIFVCLLLPATVDDIRGFNVSDDACVFSQRGEQRHFSHLWRARACCCSLRCWRDCEVLMKNRPTGKRREEEYEKEFVLWTWGAQRRVAGIINWILNKLFSRAEVMWRWRKMLASLHSDETHLEMWDGDFVLLFSSFILHSPVYGGWDDDGKL